MIEFNDISSEKDGRLALRHVSFAISDSEFLFICTDKMEDVSSLFSFLISPGEGYKGSINVDNEPAFIVKEREKYNYIRRFGIVSESIGLAKSRSIYENLHLASVISAPLNIELNRHIADIMNLTGIRGIARRFPEELSHLEKTKVKIARALVVDPKIVLCVNPIYGLDFIDSMEIIRLLFDVNLYGPAVVMSTTNAAIISSLDKRILLLENGEIRHERKGKMEASL